jgi:uncharacterized repeat protein (TIGR01451 family)
MKHLPHWKSLLLAAWLPLCGLNSTWAQTLSPTSVLRTCTAAEIRATERYWPLQNGVMLDFGVSGSGYTVASNPAATSAEGNSAVTDATGQLLFFVDGGTIYRSNGTVMPNGSGIRAQPSAEQGSVAFANPGKEGEYYVFTNNTVTGGFVSPTSDRTWYYAIVDMTANGGLGAVTVKNVALADTAGKSSEALTAIPNAAGDGFWVVGIELYTNKIMAFEVTSSGVGPLVESTMGYTDASIYTSLAFNSDGSKLAAQNRVYPTGAANISVMDFDRSTGMVSNALAWQVSGLGDYHSLYSSAFSPSGQYLYVSTVAANGTSYLYSYDLSSGNAAAIAGTQQRITRTGSYGGALRIGADGALWWANGIMGTQAANVAYRLPSPDTRPTALGAFTQIAVNGGGDYSALGLTQTLPSCFRTLPPEITITKTSSTPGPVAAGGSVDYVVTITNIGLVAVPQLQLTDAFPAGLASASWTCAATGGTPAQTCPSAAGSATAPGNLLDQTFDLQVGATVTYTITAQAGAAAVTSTANTATATPASGAACSAGGAQQASCSASTPGASGPVDGGPTSVPVNAPWALLGVAALAAGLGGRRLRQRA